MSHENNTMDCCELCARPYRGTGNFRCVTCCARLVLAARPSAEYQLRAVEAIEESGFGVTRDQVRERMREIDAGAREQALAKIRERRAA